MTESEYLRRELSIHWKKASTAELKKSISVNFRNGSRTLIISSDVSKIYGIVRSSPKDSIVLMILSDEAYSYQNLKMAMNQSVFSVFRNYSISRLSPPEMIKLFSNGWVDFYKSGLARHTILLGFFRSLKANVHAGVKTIFWRKIKKPIVIFPLGYTDKFSRSYCSIVGLDEGHSLFENACSNDGYKSILISHIGAKGSLQRQVGLKFASRLKKSFIHVAEESWGAHDSSILDTNYCKSMLSSIYCAALPGYFSNESFRYYEALICGAIPMRYSASLSQGTIDMTTNQHWNSVVNLHALEQILEEKSELERVRLFEKITTENLQYISKTREILKQHLFAS